MPKQQIDLTDSEADFIRESIESGRFRDATEVIRAGLHALLESQSQIMQAEAELRELLLKAKRGGICDASPAEIWALAEFQHAIRGT